MFGFEYEIVKEFPNYFLDYQEHDNDSTRWTDRIVSNLGDWSGNIFDFYSRVANRITQDVKTPFALNGITRVDDTPIHKALREALANALIHANYYDRRGLVIHRSPQHITIANPGGLRISVDDAVFGGISDPRNVTLLKLFGMINFAERAGTGVSGIYAAWEKEGWKAPALEEQFNPDRTVLSLDLSPIGDNVGDNGNTVGDNGNSIGDNGDSIGDNAKQRIIGYLTENMICKASDIAQLLDLKPSRTRDYLALLVAEG
jgi:predicted HTH transcriptional regulator